MNSTNLNQTDRDARIIAEVETRINALQAADAELKQALDAANAAKKAAECEAFIEHGKACDAAHFAHLCARDEAEHTYDLLALVDTQKTTGADPDVISGFEEAMIAAYGDYANLRTAGHLILEVERETAFASVRGGNLDEFDRLFQKMSDKFKAGIADAREKYRAAREAALDAARDANVLARRAARIEL